jgi:transcriptional regulator with XRE-family HTH domain
MIDEKRLYVALGERIRRAREGHPTGRMTQAELADAVQLERTSITNIEKGNQKIPVHMLYRLCDVLRIPVAETLPAVAEVTREVEATQLNFAGQTYRTTPRVAEALAEFLTAEAGRG